MAHAIGTLRGSSATVEELWTLDRLSTVALLEIRSIVTLSLYEGTSSEVAQHCWRLIQIVWSSLKLNAQTGRSWLQQNAMLLTRATRKLIAARYPPCVSIHFPWHNSINAVSSCSCRATNDSINRPVSVQSSYASPDSHVGRSYEHLWVARVKLVPLLQPASPGLHV